ncbi:MAG: S1 family peptidase [Proteobacteria bacterium]|nr:S1 family peptidase [Pseudomonadota bacterium]
MTNKNRNTKATLLSSIIAHHCRKLTLLVSLPLISLHGIANEDHDIDTTQKSTNEMSVTQDTYILAKELGVSSKEIAQSLVFQERFEAFFKETLKKYPNKISRVWIEPAPSQEAYIQFVGKMPKVTTDLNIDVFDGGVYSFQEQEDRAIYLSKLLKDNKQVNFMTYFDHKTGQIKLEMKTANRSKALTLESLDSLLLKNNKLDNDEKSVFDNLSVDEIDLTVTEGLGEIYKLETARGGEWLTRGGLQSCTSGWAVSGPNGNGIITAAHCSGLDGLDHHFTTADPDMTWRSQERGSGDVEYHTTTHTESAEYWASENALRDVTGIRWTIFMLTGQSVCEYGRSSNTRTCNHNVISNNVTATFTDGVTVSNLVRVTGDNSINGDSGGPWSWGTTAWGVHSGSNGSTSLFTPVQRAQSELNVTILTQ